MCINFTQVVTGTKGRPVRLDDDYSNLRIIGNRFDVLEQCFKHLLRKRIAVGFRVESEGTHTVIGVIASYKVVHAEVQESSELMWASWKE